MYGLSEPQTSRLWADTYLRRRWQLDGEGSGAGSGEGSGAGSGVGSGEDSGMHCASLQYSPLAHWRQRHSS